MRQISLLERLHHSGPMRIDELAEQFRLSVKTVNKDLQEAEAVIAPVTVADNGRKLHSLHFPAGYALPYIYSRFLEASSRISLLELLFFKESLSYAELCEQLFLSESTVQRSIKAINRVLRPHGFYIATNPVRIVGHEGAISNFFIVLFSEKYSIPSDAFPQPKQRAVQAILVQWLEQNKIELNFPDINKLTVWLLVAFQRLASKEATDAITSPIQGLEEYEAPNREAESMFRLGFRESFQQNRLLQAVNMIFPGGYALSYPFVQKSCEEFPENKAAYDCAIALIHRLSAYLELPVHNHESLVTDLFNLLLIGRHLKLPQFILHDEKRFFFKMATEQEKELFYILEEALEEICLPGYTWQQSDYYELFYIITTHWSNLLPGLHQQRKKCRIALVFDTDQEHSRYIKRQLEYHFKERVVIEILQYAGFAALKESAKNYDLLLTTIQAPAPDIENLLCIRLMLASQDWFAISQKIREVNERPD